MLRTKPDDADEGAPARPPRRVSRSVFSGTRVLRATHNSPPRVMRVCQERFIFKQLIYYSKRLHSNVCQ
jgi:hypothetical protein